MRDFVRFPLAAFAALIFAVVAAGTTGAALAQAAPRAAQAGKQIALTEKQIESVLAAQKDFNALGDERPTASPGKPAPNMLSKLESVAKKHGFAGYADYTIVLDNIGLVLGGFDPKTKTYVGAEAALRLRIAAVQADKTISADDKKDALEELNAAMKALPPAVENKGNIALVGKHYDGLSAVMKDNE